MSLQGWAALYTDIVLGMVASDFGCIELAMYFAGCDDGSISSARSPKLCASVCENHGTCKMMLFDSSRPDINW